MLKTLAADYRARVMAVVRFVLIARGLLGGVVSLLFKVERWS